MKFRYVGDRKVLTPEGIPTGPLYLKAYGYRFKKSETGDAETPETVIDIPDDTLLCDQSGVPNKRRILVCRKLLYNSHFEPVEDDPVGEIELPQKRKYTRRKPKEDEPITV